MEFLNCTDAYFTGIALIDGSPHAYTESGYPPVYLDPNYRDTEYDLNLSKAILFGRTKNSTTEHHLQIDWVGVDNEPIHIPDDAKYLRITRATDHLIFFQYSNQIN